MKKKDCLAITESFLEILINWGINIMPLKSDRILRTLEIVSESSISVESSRMQFPIPITVTEKGSEENLNTQLDGNCVSSNADFRVAGILTNYRTRYDPSWAVRAIRRYKEKNYRKARKLIRQDNDKEMTLSHIEIVGRIARNDPPIQKLMEESYSKEFRYSALGCLMLFHSSERLDHGLWVNIPILGIPGTKMTVAPAKEKARQISENDVNDWNSAVPEIIKDFGIAYQMPDLEVLKDGGYVYATHYELKK